jgi:hypothetical protein
MLVTLQNVTFTSDLTDDGSGRDTAKVSADTSTNGVALSNEMFDLGAWNKKSGVIGKNKTVKSVTGIVTWFFSFHVAPRSPDDIVVQ